jgi:hypothetical protein
MIGAARDDAGDVIAGGGAAGICGGIAIIGWTTGGGVAIVPVWLIGPGAVGA